MSLNLRPFDDATEALAAQWRAQACSDNPWSPEGPPGKQGGILEGFFVSHEEVRAFAKPSRTANRSIIPQPMWHAHETNPLAAHEKIASDLAYSLRLPIPPALLWDRGDGCGPHPQHCVVSAVPFWPAYTWEQVMAAGIHGQFIPSLSQAASAMVAFDTWLDNRDRVNAGNLLLHQSKSTQQVQWAYIDYAQSMSFSWLEGPPPPVAPPQQVFPGIASVNRDVTHETVSAIEALSDDEIVDIVQRVPASFMNRKRSSCIVEGLRERRKALRTVLHRKYGAPL